MSNINDLQIPSSDDTINVSTSTPSSLKSDKPYSLAFITVETNDIRYWTTGDTPTATSGHLIKAGTSFELDNILQIKNFKAIAISAAAVLQVS